MHWSAIVALPLLAAIPTAHAQLSGSVGPLTTVAEKAAVKTCNVLDYGAKADLSTDLGAALVSAFTACKSGGLVYVPEGNYAMTTWATLDKGTAWALQLDGVIYRKSTEGGNMIMIEHATDFEMFSSNSAGAMQGLGYVFHAEGTSTTTRLLRLQNVESFSLHDIILVDAPAFHLVMDSVEDGEVYNLAIRGGDKGGLDGVDIMGSNVWIHDVEVTNKDECVTVKSPSNNLLIESIYCNWSGGCAMGSLGADTDITDITYRNVYTWNSNQMYMIKSNGGSGTVQNIVLENFIGHGNAYSLDIDTSWAEETVAAGDGIEISNVTITNWKGTEASGVERGPIKVLCPSSVPCYDVVIDDFAMWTESGDSQWYYCDSAYGSGYCLKESGGKVDGLLAYTGATTTVTVAPTGYSAPTMAADLKTAFGTDSSIPIPTIPSSFYPGVTPISPLASAAAATTSAVAAISATASPVVTSAAAATSSVTLSSSSKSSTTSSSKSSATSTSKSSTTSSSKSSVTSSSTSTSLLTAAFSSTSTLVSSVAPTSVSPVSVATSSVISVSSSSSLPSFTNTIIGGTSTALVASSSSFATSVTSSAISYTSVPTTTASSSQTTSQEASPTNVPEPDDVCEPDWSDEVPAAQEQNHGHSHAHVRRHGRRY